MCDGSEKKPEPPPEDEHLETYLRLDGDPDQVPESMPAEPDPSPTAQALVGRLKPYQWRTVALRFLDALDACDRDEIGGEEAAARLVSLREDVLAWARREPSA